MWTVLVCGRKPVIYVCITWIRVREICVIPTAHLSCKNQTITIIRKVKKWILSFPVVFLFMEVAVLCFLAVRFYRPLRFSICSVQCRSKFREPCLKMIVLEAAHFYGIQVSIYVLFYEFHSLTYCCLFNCHRSKFWFLKCTFPVLNITLQIGPFVYYVKNQDTRTVDKRWKIMVK